MESSSGFYYEESQLDYIRQLKRAGIGQHDLVSIYCSIIRSSRFRVEYAAQAWSILAADLSNLIKSIQRRALKIVYPSLSFPFLSFPFLSFSLLWPRDFRSTENEA